MRIPLVCYKLYRSLLQTNLFTLNIIRSTNAVLIKYGECLDVNNVHYNLANYCSLKSHINIPYCVRFNCVTFYLELLNYCTSKVPISGIVSVSFLFDFPVDRV